MQVQEESAVFHGYHLLSELTVTGVEFQGFIKVFFSIHNLFDVLDTILPKCKGVFVILTVECYGL